jgi:hypothetical protein
MCSIADLFIQENMSNTSNKSSKNTALNACPSDIALDSTYGVLQNAVAISDVALFPSHNVESVCLVEPKVNNDDLRTTMDDNNTDHI